MLQKQHVIRSIGSSHHKHQRSRPRPEARAGIDKRVHPHALRHTHAVELLREGVAVTVISRQLGHSSIATTAVYLDHLEPADVIDAIQAREWPAQAT